MNEQKKKEEDDITSWVKDVNQFKIVDGQLNRPQILPDIEGEALKIVSENFEAPCSINQIDLEIRSIQMSQNQNLNPAADD